MTTCDITGRTREHGSQMDLVVSQQPVSLFEAMDLFRVLAESETVVYNPARDGCAARSHLMCRLMTEKGYAPLKAWAFEQAPGTLTFLAANDVLYAWWYHVAPALLVEMPDGTRDIAVFDPALYDSPVRLSTWRDAIDAQEQRTLVAPFGRSPTGWEGDYTPADPAHGIKARPTNEKADEDARDVMDKLRRLAAAHGLGPRVVYSGDLGQLAAKHGYQLPQQGRGWINATAQARQISAPKPGGRGMKR